MTDWIRPGARLCLYARALECGSMASARTGRRYKAQTRARCAWCGCALALGAAPGPGRLQAATLDHVNPFVAVRQGRNAPWNLVAACWDCNCTKGETDWSERPCLQSQLPPPPLPVAARALARAYPDLADTLSLRLCQALSRGLALTLPPGDWGLWLPAPVAHAAAQEGRGLGRSPSAAGGRAA